MQTLSEYLIAKEITQSAFADRVGVTQAQISRLTRGPAQPSLDLAIKISAETNGAVPICAWRAFRVLASHQVSSATAAPTSEAAS